MLDVELKSIFDIKFLCNCILLLLQSLCESIVGNIMIISLQKVK